jgi:hypothetical protein
LKKKKKKKKKKEEEEEEEEEEEKKKKKKKKKKRSTPWHKGNKRGLCLTGRGNGFCLWAFIWIIGLCALLYTKMSFGSNAEETVGAFLGNFRLPPRTLRVGPISSPETSLRNYDYSLRNNPEERGSQLALLSATHHCTDLLSPVLRWEAAVHRPNISNLKMLTDKTHPRQV